MTTKATPPTEPKPKKRTPTIWDECRAFDRRRSELQASKASHEAKAREAAEKLAALIAEASDEVLAKCGVKRPAP